jgi:signal transduction histidine kinase
MQVVERLIQQAAFRSEAAFSAARLLFCAAFGIRAFSAGFPESDSSGPVHAALVWLIPGLPMAFSALVLHRFWTKRLTMRWLAASVLLDALLCTLGLGTNVIFPGSLYRGALGSPDTAGILVVMMAAGLRLSPKLAWFGIVANAVGLLLLVIGDLTISPAPNLDYSLGTVLLWPVFMIGAAAFALLSAWRTRTLALHGAEESVRLERTKLHLQSLLHGHHDAHALLSSATLNADLLTRASTLGTEAKDLAETLRQDLALLKDCVLELKQRADGELITAQDASEVLVDEQVQRIAQRIGPQLDDVQLVTRTGAPGLSAVVAGGPHGFARILLNLLLNARDAHGGRRTSQIWIETAPCIEGARLTVRDDGPGFPASTGMGPTTRLEGAGVGLTIVAAIAEASGGAVRLLSNDPHGARVDVSLPARNPTLLGG